MIRKQITLEHFFHKTQLIGWFKCNDTQVRYSYRLFNQPKFYKVDLGCRNYVPCFTSLVILITGCFFIPTNIESLVKFRGTWAELSSVILIPERPRHVDFLSGVLDNKGLCTSYSL